MPIRQLFIFINVFIFATLLFVSCKSINKEQLYSEFYKQELKQFVSGSARLEVLKKIAKKAENDPGFNIFLQKQIIKESDHDHNIRASLYAIFYVHKLKPSLKTVKAMLDDKDLTICSMALTYSEKYKYTEALKEQIYKISQKKSKEYTWKREINEKSRQEYTRYIRGRARRMLNVHRQKELEKKKLAKKRPVVKPKDKKPIPVHGRLHLIGFRGKLLPVELKSVKRRKIGDFLLLDGIPYTVVKIIPKYSKKRYAGKIVRRDESSIILQSKDGKYTFRVQVRKPIYSPVVKAVVRDRGTNKNYRVLLGDTIEMPLNPKTIFSKSDKRRKYTIIKYKVIGLDKKKKQLVVEYRNKKYIIKHQ